MRPDHATPKRRHRGDEQDAPKAPLSHPRQGPPGKQERRAQVDRQRLVERGGVDLLIARLAAQAMVGDQDVDRSERALDFADQPCRGLRVCHV